MSTKKIVKKLLLLFIFERIFLKKLYVGKNSYTKLMRKKVTQRKQILYIEYALQHVKFPSEPFYHI